MKIGLKFLAVLCTAVLVAGCGGSKSDDEGGGSGPDKPDPEPPQGMSVSGGWVLTSWAGTSEMSGKVYVQFNDDKSFALYQAVNDLGFNQYAGTYTLTSDNVLSGTYSDAKAWESSYKIVSKDDTTLTLKSERDDVVSVYTSGTIPDYVKDQVIPGVRGATDRKPFL